jgi:N-acetylglucosamine-6-phosphate deacetylase
MIVLSGGDVLLADGIRSSAIVIEGDRIESIDAGSGPGGDGISRVDVTGHLVVPGFVDVHVHGVDGVDVLDGPHAIGKIAGGLPKYGVTAFCPTTVACSPADLRQTLDGVNAIRREPPVHAAHVIGAHLESNFISPEYRGAQPERHLCRPSSSEARPILDEIARASSSVSILTLAPELDGSLDLVRSLAAAGICVSLGHSGASFETAEAAIDAGARHATHLFNRMPPLNHRDPGLAGAILTRKEVAAEIICDGVHVHSPMIQVAIAAKGIDRMMAITDGTAASGLAEGGVATLGGRRICVRAGAAYLDDGTLAGSVATMDLVFWFLVQQVGLSIKDASRMCSTTPAAELRLDGRGVIAPGAWADLVVLDRQLAVKQTYVSGRLAYSAL